MCDFLLLFQFVWVQNMPQGNWICSWKLNSQCSYKYQQAEFDGNKKTGISIAFIQTSPTKIKCFGFSGLREMASEWIYGYYETSWLIDS